MGIPTIRLERKARAIWYPISQKCKISRLPRMVKEQRTEKKMMELILIKAAKAKKAIIL